MSTRLATLRCAQCGWEPPEHKPAYWTTAPNHGEGMTLLERYAALADHRAQHDLAYADNARVAALVMFGVFLVVLWRRR